MVNRVAADELEHGINDLMRGGHVPRRKSLLAARPDSGREQTRRFNLERDRLYFARVCAHSRGDRDRWVHYRC